MFRKQAPFYSATLLVYLGIITLLSWPIPWQLSFFWVGGFFGLLLYNLDHVAYLLWQAPEAATAVKFRQLSKERRFRETFTLLEETSQERKRLVGHSVIFQIVLVVLAFFAVSSTASYFGKGMVMGMFLYSLVNQGLLLLRGRDLTNWLWQVRIKPSRKGEAIYFLILVVLFVFFSLMII